MDLKDKVKKALVHSLPVEYVRLEDDDGISGFVVSPRFEGMSGMDRQALIEGALGESPDPLTPEEKRRVLMIGAVTPLEYQSVGPRIRIHKVSEMPGGTVRIVLHGGLSDAEYVRGALDNQKGVQTTKPKQVAGAVGVLTSFLSKGPKADPLTKEKALRVLKKDRSIEVMANA
jgi:hypothetical protein